MQGCRQIQMLQKVWCCQPHCEGLLGESRTVAGVQKNYGRRRLKASRPINQYIKESPKEDQETSSLTLMHNLASKVADAGKIRIGWAMCRVKLLERLCYKCQGTGHVAAACKSEAKRKVCFTCKSLEHLARECVAPSKGKSPGA